MSVLRDVFNGETALDYPRWWRRAVTVSLVAIVLSIGSFGVRGLNLGIDFEGGTSFEVVAPGASVADARAVMAGLGSEDARIQTVDGDVIRIRSEVSDPARASQIRDVLEVELCRMPQTNELVQVSCKEITEYPGRPPFVRREHRYDKAVLHCEVPAGTFGATPMREGERHIHLAPVRTWREVQAANRAPAPAPNGSK